MLTDYEIKHIRRGKNRTKMCVAFYEGEMENQAVHVPVEGGEPTRETQSVYVRSASLKVEDYDLEGELTDEEVQKFLKGELAKDKSRTAIPEQKL